MLLESQTADYVDFARYLMYNSRQILKIQCFTAKSVVHNAIQDIKTSV